MYHLIAVHDVFTDVEADHRFAGLFASRYEAERFIRECRLCRPPKVGSPFRKDSPLAGAHRAYVQWHGREDEVEDLQQLDHLDLLR